MLNQFFTNSPLARKKTGSPNCPKNIELCKELVGNCAGRVNCSGNSNNFLGNRAGFCNTTGAYNNFLGYRAGRYNTKVVVTTSLVIVLVFVIY